MDSMRILYIAVHENNRGWGSEHFVNDGFNEIGVETSCVDFRKYRKEIVECILQVPTFDYLFLQRGDYFPIELLRAVRRPKFFWASELVSRNRDQDRLLSCGLFDHTFVHTKACKEAIVRNGWLQESQITVLLNGFDPKTHYPLSVEKDIDVLFIGNMLKRRKEWTDKIGKNCSLHTAVGIYGDKMVTLINRAKIVLNIHSEEFQDTETRVFEVLGCRRFLLTEKLSVENPFTDRKHLVECTDLGDMIRQIQYYLKHDAEREQIAEQGYMEAIEKHTYKRRAEYLATLFTAYPIDFRVEAIDRQRLQEARGEAARLYRKVIFDERCMRFRQHLRKFIRR